MHELAKDLAKNLWEHAKPYFAATAQHQIKHTEALFEIAGNHKICWICGGEDNLVLNTAKTRTNDLIKLIHCETCSGIQKSIGLNVLKTQKIKSR